VTLDAFASRYGWDAEQIDRQPQQVIEEMPLLWKAQAAAKRAAGAAGGVETARAKAYQQIEPRRR
jgi:hypothetical protein